MPVIDEASEPLVRVAALHALAYCERLFYLEEVEELRVADASVYAGRTLHVELADEDGLEMTCLDVSSEALGLVGRLDALRRRDGAWIPYEHKRGRCARSPSKSPEAWPSDSLQVLAYALLLEEHTGHPAGEARIRYHGSGVTVRVSMDEAGRQRVRTAVERARQLRQSTARPPESSNAKVCLRCSLAPVCLPEEERLATDPDWEAVRLFPQRHEEQIIHVHGHRTQIGRSGETLVLRGEDGLEAKVPIHDVQALVLHGYSQITTQAVHLCSSHEVAIHWLTPGGRYAAGLASGAGPVQRRIRQYEALSKPELVLRLARRLAHAKVENQLRYLLRATRGQGARLDGVETALAAMRAALHVIHRAQATDTIRGAEGNAARAYFSTLPSLLGTEIPLSMHPAGRSRRPPADRFNALLSFGYSMLYRTVLQSVIAVGLEPAFGFLHTPRSSAHPLVLDLMELFRVAVWDVAVIGSINRKQWDPDADFSVTKAAVWLSESGRSKVIRLYENRLNEVWRHPIAEYSLSYGRTIELEVRLLEKEWTGKEGLFARVRLR